MSYVLAIAKDKERAREILDWSVFSLGALSLTIAITATVISHVDSLRVSSVDTSQEGIEVSVLPDVL